MKNEEFREFIAEGKRRTSQLTDGFNEDHIYKSSDNKTSE